MMEIALLLLLLVVVLWFAQQLSNKLSHNSQQLAEIQDELHLLRKQLEKQPAPTTDTAAPPRPAVTKQTIEEVQRSLQPPAVPPVPQPESPAQPAAVPLPRQEPVAAFSPPPRPAAFANFRRNLDWEKFIGENLINKLGIAILVLGIGFFVKYAIDQDWINEVGRVAIGMLAGGALLGVAHWLRRQYQAFSSVLVGGGMAVLYFTIAIAFHEYSLFSQTVAFILMVGITGFTIMLAIAYDRIELAVLALIGGFASPFMVSTGAGNYVVLFVFILLLNLGILVLAYFKKWPLLNLIAYLFTIILYGGWLSTHVIGTPHPPYIGALVFATLFYLVFFLMNIIHNVKEQRHFTAPEIMVLLSNTFLYYSAGMYALANVAGGAYQGLFTAAIAVFNFVFAYLLYQNQKTDKNLVYLLIGLVLTFLSLTAPVQLHGNYITLFWALEAVLLLWLAQRSGIALIRVASVVVLALMFFSLTLDWDTYALASEEPLRIVFNKVFVTGVVAVAALAGTRWLLRQEQVLVLVRFLPAQMYRHVVAFALGLTLYLVLLLELRYQLAHSAYSYGTQYFILATYNYLYLLGLVLLARRSGNVRLQQAGAALAAAGIMLYLALLHPQTLTVRSLYLLAGEETLGSFLLHYLPLLITLALLLLLLQLVHQVYGYTARVGKITLWFCSFAVVFMASAELEHLVLLRFYTTQEAYYPLLQQVHKISFPILWGLSSFVLMLIGMRHKLKTLRIISLSLFFITLLKLFLFDIRGISEGGKIAAFICLGLILLVISFMYQKLKVLILQDDTAKTIPDEVL
ncbi:DUF2339 domain-containing protein [Pontibacter chitinilyticus]|uniref:DUF2339 domain-containing protein n=1 Tax=Pontibacter chitinilyticus TaxID=2674989 RepID=UPI003219DABB